ncbi:probable multidrug resistance-associated protein lethal(2)03659 isoform X2 [Cimex lectularius]|nr:probable multidrug resistance-associated protein lethal(2)03659 isoform X2 [Cimex lectularius]
MNEIISGIQVIKMYTWEKPFANLVSEARKKEIKYISKSSYIRGILLSFIVFHSRASIFCTIIAYALFGNNISAEKVFVLASFYNTLRQTMTVFFPLAITQTAEGRISVKRIREFLLLDEFQTSKDCVTLEKNGDVLSFDKKQTPERYVHLLKEYDTPCVEIKNASAKWNENNETLNNLSLDVYPGKLTVVIGPVGSGKSSLLYMILRELELYSGSMKVCGKMSYASQDAWLFHGSVRQNILFGEEFNKEKYKKVIRACALKTDFEQLPFGDKTIVGERGVSLSGGQRARINLARAVYKDADIYLLDDPLSAVDPHVSKHLFEDCIQGYLKSKVVILVTHQLQYLEKVDQIILLENGHVKMSGSYTDLKESKLDFTGFLNTESNEDDELIDGPRRLSRQSSIHSVASSMNEDRWNGEPVENVEYQMKGSVSSKIYYAYFRAGGGMFIISVVLMLFFFVQILASGGDYWITHWVNLEEDNISQSDRDFCIYVFTALIVSTVVFTLIRSYMFFYMCMRSSTNLHNQMFNALTRTTMWFFNNNSSGRILNRFSKDMGSIDELLTAALIDVLQIFITLFGIIIVVATVNPWLLIPTAVCAIIFYFLRIFYLSTSRSIKRLEGITRSPVFTHVNSSMQGLTTIRAFGAQKILIKEFDYHQDLHSSAWYLFIASSRAFGFWLDFVCLIYISLVTLSFLIFGGEKYGGNVGLAISQSIGLTGMFQWGMRQTAELENQMTSVERVMEYTSLEQEPPLESPPDKRPKESWPENGKIEFKNLSLRYSPLDPWVLRDLNFTIEPNEKVGIVGRTGAGKSSLLSALFRLSELDGKIIIDGVDTSEIGLHELRSKLSIIPQEPVLFSGTLRKNLDPFDEYNDDVLWSAIDQVKFREAVKELAGGLQGRISEGGSNLSVGQRQLVCLARAIIKNNKILVLDEATANVDPKTDTLIQQTIRDKFKDCTVLTIAHRLHTVMDSDKVLVMDAGTMVEFDHPYKLLENKNGFFSKMVENTGTQTAARLMQMAHESFAVARDPEEQ